MTIEPGVVIEGRTYYPTSAMYIFAFAMRGFQWAIDEVLKNEDYWRYCYEMRGHPHVENPFAVRIDNDVA